MRISNNLYRIRIYGASETKRGAYCISKDKNNNVLKQHKRLCNNIVNVNKDVNYCWDDHDFHSIIHERV